MADPWILHLSTYKSAFVQHNINLMMQKQRKDLITTEYELKNKCFLFFPYVHFILPYSNILRSYTLLHTVLVSLAYSFISHFSQDQKR